MRAVACAVLAAACTSSSPPHWHVSGNALRDPDGRAVILRGVNLSGAQKNTPYLDDKTLADYQRVRDAWGFNAIRFLMTWSAVEPAQGQYDDAYLDQVAERIGWAQQSGLVVILDMHEDVYGEGFGFDGAPRWTCDESRYAAFVPQTPWFLSNFDPNVEACVDDFYTMREKQFAAAWAHVAQKLAKVDGVIGFDVLNEPGWGTHPIFKFETDELAPMYKDVVAAVRSKAPDWVAFLEPSSARNGGIATNLVKPFPFGDVMYAPHSYDSNAEMGSAFDPTHRQPIIDNIAALSDEAKALDAGLWIGEYGGIATDPGIVDYMTANYDGAGAVAASTMYWAYDKGGGYSLLNADGTERTMLLDTLVRPYPERVAGDPIAYGFDPATKTFTFTWKPAHGETRIEVPSRTYPSGYAVDCGGCSYTMDGAELVIDSATTGSVTITAP